jgi:hypothetical protein
MIATEPNDFAAEIHDRMNALDERAACTASGETGTDYLK